MARKIANGNYDVKAVVSTEDEIGDLATQLNNMASKIKTFYSELLKEKDSVEQKVKNAIEETEKQKVYLSDRIEEILCEMEKFASGDLSVHLISANDDDIR